MLIKVDILIYFFRAEMHEKQLTDLHNKQLESLEREKQKTLEQEEMNNRESLLASKPESVV